KAAGAAAGLATILLLIYEGRDVVSDDVWGLVPAAFLALSPMFAFWSASGIETAAYAFVLLAAWRGLRLGRPVLAGAAFGAAALLRPEGALMAVVAAATVIVGVIVVGEKRQTRPALLALALAAAVAAPYFVWRMQRFGDLFPNTVHAKWQPFGGIRYFL